MGVRGAQATAVRAALLLPSALLPSSTALLLPSKVSADDSVIRVNKKRQVCVTSLPNRGLYNAAEPMVRRTTACTRTGMAKGPRLQIYASDVHVKSTSPLRSITADWIAPPVPTRRPPFDPSVVFFWPGLKAGKPEMGYPVLQPVLQYSGHGPTWTLQSWFVDGSDPAFPVVTVPSVEVKPGGECQRAPPLRCELFQSCATTACVTDRVTSFMSLSDDDTTWTVSGTNQDTGEDSTLRIAFSQASRTPTYDYAMLVNENINVRRQCARMPASTGLTFTNLTINGERKPAGWITRANCAGSDVCDCGNAVGVDGDGDVRFSWRTSI